VPFSGAQELQALEVVKEGFRRAIQSAMGSNFLPTQAQKRNEKSGVALETIDRMASVGTYHFVYAYNSLIRQTAIVGEDLMDKIYDYSADIGVLGADEKAESITINDPDKKDAVDTRGDYLVTVSVGPSSDSEREEAREFTDQLVSQIERIAQVAGPKIAAAVLAKSIRMRNLGPLGDQLAELIEPPEFRTKDGEKPNPEVLAMKAQLDHVMGMLQQAGQEKQAKTAELQGKAKIEQINADKDVQLQIMKDATALAVAKIAASTKGGIVTLEAQNEAIALAQEHAQTLQRLGVEHAHERAMADAEHQRALAAQQQQHELGLEAGGVGHQQALEQQQQAADLAPQPEAGEA
jgi:hypothetical protein